MIWDLLQSESPWQRNDAKWASSLFTGIGSKFHMLVHI